MGQISGLVQEIGYEVEEGVDDLLVVTAGQRIHRLKFDVYRLKRRPLNVGGFLCWHMPK